MPATYFRYDGTVRTAPGEAVAGASIAVLTQPADTSTEPGSPLATLFAGPTSNNVNVSGASWLAGTATLTLASIPSDLVIGSFIRVAGINPAGYNGVVQVLEINGLTVSYELDTNPGVYVSGGTVATSALPNSFESDNLGNFSFYALPGIYTVQIFDLPGGADAVVFPDQNVVAGGGNGSVTSVGLALPAEFNVTGSPVNSTGTLTGAWANQSANRVFAGPSSGPAGVPSFRALVAADIPNVGTVKSVALTITVPAYMTQSVGGSPVTSTGTLAATIGFANQATGTFFAAPSGGAGQPSFRNIVDADLPGNLLKQAVVALSSADILALLGTPKTLVAAPGVGFTIDVLSITIEFFGGAAAYTDAGGAVSFSIGSASQALASNAIFLVTTTPNKRFQRVGPLLATDTAGNPPTDENAPLTISKVTNNFAAGNGTAKVLVSYQILPTT